MTDVQSSICNLKIWHLNSKKFAINQPHSISGQPSANDH